MMIPFTLWMEGLNNRFCPCCVYGWQDVDRGMEVVCLPPITGHQHLLHWLVSNATGEDYLRVLNPFLLIVGLTNDHVLPQFSGLCGIYVAFVIPALLQRKSSKAQDRLFGTRVTMYSSPFSGRQWTTIVLLCSIVAFFVLIYQMCT